jgi:fatty acid-binding protein DegV
MAADMRDAGKGKWRRSRGHWLNANSKKRFITSFSPWISMYFQAQGAYPGPAATLGAMLNICPIMRLDKRQAWSVANDKVRGQ